MEKLEGNVVLKYPRNVTINFRKLDKPTLIRILRFYGVSPNANLTQSEIAAMTARVFHASAVSDTDILDKFGAKFFGAKTDTAKNPTSKKRSYSSRETLDSVPARCGEQVAAKVSRINENGSWILGNVLEYHAVPQLYEVQDEDDVNRLMHISEEGVKRLEDSASHLRKGDKVLAVFPETTSFYRSVVVKTPKPPANPNANWDVVVRFEDDEDESGKAPARRVPGRFVLLRRDVDDLDEDEEDEEDEEELAK